MSTITLTGNITITIIGADGHNLGSALIPTNARKCAPVTAMPEEPPRAVIGRYITVLRTNQRWTQAELGEMLGMKPMTVSRLESGQRPISIDELALIAKTFGLTCAELISVIDTEEAPYA